LYATLVLEKDPLAYLTLGERRLGLHARAFNFHVDVDHEKTSSALKAVVLRIKVPKVEDVKKVDKTVNVENENK